MNGLIDVHAHFCPGDFPKDPLSSGTPRWPCMQCQSATKRTVMLDGKPFRELDDRSWDVSRRLADMDADGVTMQALSPMPELLSYWIDPKVFSVLADCINGAIAEIAAKHPARFCGLGMVPMQDTRQAIVGLRDIKKKFGLSGVEIGSNINGTLLGDPRFDAFYAAAEELELAVFVHALHPVATKGLGVGPMYDAMAGFPIDTAMSIAHILLADIPKRFPKLRIGFSHGGGAILPILHRLDNGWHMTNGFGGRLEMKPSDSARTFFYDSLVYDAGFLAHFAEEMGSGHIFLGTDYPYPIMQKNPAAFLANAPTTLDNHKSFTTGAAQKFLIPADG